MSDHSDPPTDRRAENAALLAKQKAAQAEEQRRLKVDKDAKRIKKDEVDRAARARADLEKVASGLKPKSELQLTVSSRLNDQVTYELGNAIRIIEKTPSLVIWVCPSRALALETIQRAYPLALQLGVMANVRDTDCSLNFPNGGVISFTWPGKEEAA